jgi:hypothetical protein
MFFLGQVFFKKYLEIGIRDIIISYSYGHILLFFILFIFFFLTKNAIYVTNLHLIPIIFAIGIVFIVEKYKKNYFEKAIFYPGLSILLFYILITLKRLTLLELILMLCCVFYYIFFKNIGKKEIVSIILSLSIIIFSISKLESNIDIMKKRFQELNRFEQNPEIEIVKNANQEFKDVIKSGLFKALFGEGAGATIPFKNFFGEINENNLTDSLYGTSIKKYGLLGVLLNYFIIFFFLRILSEKRGNIFYSVIIKKIIFLKLIIYLVFSWINCWLFYNLSASIIWFFCGFFFELNRYKNIHNILMTNLNIVNKSK